MEPSGTGARSWRAGLRQAKPAPVALSGRIEEVGRAVGKQRAFSFQVAILAGLLGVRASQAAVLFGHLDFSVAMEVEYTGWCHF